MGRQNLALAFPEPDLLAALVVAEPPDDHGVAVLQELPRLPIGEVDSLAPLPGQLQHAAKCARLL